MTNVSNRRLQTSTSSASTTSPMTTQAPGEGLLSRLKKWGITSVLAVGLIIPAVIGIQIMNAPRSPADLPVPPAITQPVTVTPPSMQDVFVPPAPQQPTPPVVVAPPVQMPPPAVTAPDTTAPPIVVQPPVQQEVETFAGEVQKAFVDGALSGVEAKTLARGIQHLGTKATTQDWQLLATAYKDSRTTDEARAIFDTFFVRTGVPVGAGAEHLASVVQQAAAGDALGPALRGRLQTSQLLRLDVRPSAELPRGATVWSAPGARPQVFVEIPGQGAFGPFLTAVRGGQS